MLKYIHNFRNLIENVLCEFPFASLHILILVATATNIDYLTKFFGKDFLNLYEISGFFIMGYISSIIIEIISARKEFVKRKYYSLNLASFIIITFVTFFINENTLIKLIYSSIAIFLLIFWIESFFAILIASAIGLISIVWPDLIKQILSINLTKYLPNIDTKPIFIYLPFGLLFKLFLITLIYPKLIKTIKPPKQNKAFSNVLATSTTLILCYEYWSLFNVYNGLDIMASILITIILNILFIMLILLIETKNSKTNFLTRHKTKSN